MSGNLRGMGFMLAATVVLICQQLAVKHLSSEIHTFEIVFFRTVFGLLALTPLLLRQGLASLRTKRIGMHAVRAGLQSVSALTFFYALGIAPLAQVTALHFTSPLFVALLAILFLGERVSYRRWSAIVFGFIGAVVIVRPGADGLDLGSSLVLLSAAFWAMAMIVIKMLGRTETSVTTTAYMYILMCPITLAFAVFNWTWPNWEQIGWLAVIGLTGSYAHVFMAQALKEGDANVVTPVEFFKLIWATLFGYLLFGELPGTTVYIGGAMVFLSAVYIAYRESKLRRPRV